MRKHIISLWVKNKHGVLSRVAGMFNRRAYNIDSFSSGKINDDDIYRMTIILSVDDEPIDLIKKQLNKLVDVDKVIELDVDHTSVRELALVKLGWTEENKEELIQMAESFGAITVRSDENSVTYEFSGLPDQVDAFLHDLIPYNILAANRSGAVAIEE